MGPEDEKTLTIAVRTKKNLDYIYKKKSEGEDVEEFTQLINSMLGMVICLREDYFKGSTIEWNDVNVNLATKRNLESKKGAISNSICPNLKQTNSFSQLITKVRHGFAHNCFNLDVDKATKKITGITIWNIESDKKNRPENRVWQESFSEQELKDLAYLFVDFLKNVLT